MMTKTSVKFDLILMLMFVPGERERERDDPEVWFIKTCPQTRGPSRVVSLTPRSTETREDGVEHQLRKIFQSKMEKYFGSLPSPAIIAL